MSFASDLERGYGNGRSFGGGQGGNGGNNSNGGGYQSGGFGYGGSNPDDEYNHEKTQVSTNIRTMAAYFQQIIDSSSALGTERDSAEFRENTTAKMEETRDLARQVQASLKRLNNAASSMGTPAERKERKAVVDKLTKDFSQFNDRVSTQLSLLKQQFDQTPIRPQASGGNGFFRGGSQFQQPAYGGGYQASYVEQDDEQERIGLIRAAQQQEYYQVEQEADHNRTIIAEREDAIRRLRSDMQEVHEVFRDLATLVGEQGEMIDNIESNIQQTVAHTKQGVVEIRKAAEYQNKARSKLCCVAIIFAVLAAGAVIAVVIYLATRPKT